MTVATEAMDDMQCTQVDLSPEQCGAALLEYAIRRGILQRSLTNDYQVDWVHEPGSPQPIRARLRAK